MKYTIGKYILDVQKPFKNIDEVLKYTKEHHPELSREEIENFIQPKIKDNGTDNSTGTGPKVEESGKGNAKADPGGLAKSPNGKDKSK